MREREGREVEGREGREVEGREGEGEVRGKLIAVVKHA